MPEPTFSQPARRSPLPLFVAAAVIAAIAIAIFYLNPHDTAALSLSNTTAVPTRTTFKSNSIVVDAGPSGQDDLYVLTTLHVEDHLRLPITVDTILMTLVTSDGHEATTYAAAKEDLPAVFGAFRQLKPLQAPPLLRETAIEPGKSAEGQLVFHFPITKAVWDSRKSATIELDLYHQKPQTILVP